jgi:2-hydroxychromene-2-carboxylate isomerase
VPAVFRYDFNSPYAWLAAERIDGILPDARWQPISFGFVLRAQQRLPWSFGEGRADGIAEVERRAAECGLPPVRWREDWPVGCYSLDPLRAAFVAADRGVLREFSLAAFRRLFVEGDALAGEVTLDVAAAVGLDPEEVRSALAGPAKQRLVTATDEAIAAGVPGVPTVTVGDEHFWGDDRLEDAARAALA